MPLTAIFANLFHICSNKIFEKRLDILRVVHYNYFCVVGNMMQGLKTGALHKCFSGLVSAVDKQQIYIVSLQYCAGVVQW